jgi:DNA modification methylase
MLRWVGKQPLSQVIGLPAQRVEQYDPVGKIQALPQHVELWQEWPNQYPRAGLLFYGDNKEVLAHLLANGFRGQVGLVYIDPPFDSGADYIRKITLRGKGSTAKLDAEMYAIGEQIQYSDIWANDNYLQFMYERLLLIKELLSNTGSIFLHVNHERVHLLRCLMDEVFGSENFRNDIVWKRGPGKSHPKYFGRVKDTILFYTKTDDYVWNKQFKDISDAYRKTFVKRDEKDFYVTQPLHSGKPAKNVPEWKGARPPGGRGWAYKIAKLDEFENEGRIEWSSEGVPRLKRYLHEVSGTAIQDVWDDIVDAANPEVLQAFFNFLDSLSPDEDFDAWSDVAPVLDRSRDHTGYPTQKPTELVERMINACSKPGEIILDCFIGSGTTADAAQRLGRRWIGCDINKGAIQTSAKRLWTIISEQAAFAETLARDGKQAELIPGTEQDDAPAPAQLGFVTYRVNDYDLAIQHNEAVNLACEHIGIERIRTDSYFDGKLGDAWAKIIPFGHPLSPTDLEELKRELDARKEDPKLIKIVCLGMELAARTWVEEWNKLRKGKQAVNRIEVIELRTDPKYGKFIAHKPAQARVAISRKKNKIHVEIKDFISPTIVERLQQQAGILKPKIEDWRAMVDCVMIDTAFNGEVFNIALTDIPERKTDFVQGTYELSAPAGKNTVAVKIIDMLGEEVLTTAIV